MNTKTQRRMFAPLMCGLLVCLLSSYTFTAVAGITEIEPNDSISAAQPTPVPPTGLTISGVIGTIGGGITTDVDFFTFDATHGDTPSLMTVGALKPNATGTCTGFASIIALYDSAGNMLGQGQADCAVGEALINNVTLSATGKYLVMVSGYPHYGDQGGIPLNIGMPSPGGDYQLVINGVRNPTPVPGPAPTPAPTLTPPPTPSPSAKHVPIEVRHWHEEERDLEKRKGMWPITVAILSMPGFDAMTVDANSLTFGAIGNENSLFRCRKEGKDINRDGLVDMVCYFKPDVANFQTGHLNGILKGKTKSGQQIEGSAALKIFSVPTEKRGFEHHDKHSDDDDGNDQHNGKDKHKS